MGPAGGSDAKLVWAGSGLVAYAILWAATAAFLGAGIDDLVVFAPRPGQTSAMAFAPQFALAATGVALVFLGPGALALAALDRLPARWRRLPAPRDRRGLETLMLAFVLSLPLGAALVALEHLAPAGVSRAQILAACVVLGLGLLALGLKRARPAPGPPPEHAPSRDWAVALLGVAAIGVLVFLCRHHLALQNFSDDEQEAVEFARSLGDWVWPQWKTGSGWGFYPTFVLFAYPVHLTTLALGESEFAVRALYFASLFLVFASGVAVVELILGRPMRIVEQALVLAGFAVAAVTAIFYNTWHPYFAGVAEPSGVDLLAFALFLASAHALFRGRDLVFLAASLLLYAAMPSGAFHTAMLLGLAFLVLKGERRRALRLGLAYVALVVAYRMAVALAFPQNAGDGGESRVSDFARYFRAVGDVRDAARFLRMMLVLSAGGVLVALAALWTRRDRRLTVLALVLLASTAVAAPFAGLRHVHYHLPMVMLSYLVAVCVLAQAPARLRTALVAVVAVAAVAVTAFLVPRGLAVETNARRLGQASRLDCPTSGLEELYREAKPVEALVSWRGEGVSLHNWVYYAQAGGERGHADLVLADAAAPVPTGWREAGRGERCRLLVRDGFDRRDYAPRASYRDQPAWGLLQVRRWRGKFGPPRKAAPAA